MTHLRGQTKHNEERLFPGLGQKCNQTTFEAGMIGLLELSNGKNNASKNKNRKYLIFNHVATALVINHRGFVDMIFKNLASADI